MARSSTSEYQPAPPNYKQAGKQNGRFSAGTLVKLSTSSDGIKPNMSCPPATNGDRASGLAPSRPNSAKGQKGMRPRLSN